MYTTNVPAPLVLSAILFFVLPTTAAFGMDPLSPVDPREAHIDSLRAEGAFETARREARGLLAARQSDRRTRPYQLADARRLVQALDTTAKLSPESRSELAAAYRIQHEDLDAQTDATTLARSIEVFERILGPDHIDTGNACARLASFHRERDEYAQAEDVFQRAMTIQERELGANHPVLATTMSELAFVYLNEFRLAEAEQLYRRALTIREESLAPDNPDIAVGVHNLAMIYHYEDRLDEAEPLYKRALALLEKRYGPSGIELADTIDDLAQVYQYQMRVDDAERWYLRSIEIRERTNGPNDPDLVRTLNNLAVVYFDQGRFEESERLFRRTVQVLEANGGPDSKDVGSAVGNLAIFLTSQKRYAEAEPLHRRSLEILERRRGPDHPEVGYSLQAQADFYRAAGRPEVGVAVAARSSRIQEDDFRRNLTALSEEDALRYATNRRGGVDGTLMCYADVTQPTAELTRLTADVIVANKGLVSDELFMRRRGWVNDSDAAAVALNDSLRATQRRRAELFVEGPGSDVRAYRAQVDELGRAEEQLETALAQRSARYARYYHGTEATADAVLAHLPHGSVLVEYICFNYSPIDSTKSAPRFAALVLRRDASPVIVNLGSGATIDEQVARYRTHFSRLEAKNAPAVAPEDLEDYRQICEGLFALIWKPLEGVVGNSRLIFVSPDGSLNLVSFAGLWDPSEQEYMVERHALRYLSAGRDLIRYARDQEPGKGLLAMGMPDFDATVEARTNAPSTANVATRRHARSTCGEISRLTWNALPATRAEVDAIVANWKRESREPAYSYLGVEASEENFKSKGPGNRVIHLATHGYYLEKTCAPGVVSTETAETPRAEENPLLLSGVILAGANLHGAGASATDAEDGILTAYEVAEMDLEGTEMVVLSACESGRGTVVISEGVYGLRRAFLMSGATSVVSALWSVDDVATAELMGKLYTRRSKPYHDRIRDVQIEQVRRLRKSKQPDHPFTWGAFVLIGGNR